MKQQIKFLSASVLVFILLFSCSNQIEKSSSITFSLSKNTVRAITDEASGNWSLKITLSGNYKKEKSFEIQQDSLFNGKTFSIDDLTAGETVTVDVNVYCGDVRYYKTKETKSLTLVEGKNSIDIVLKSALGNSDFSVIDSSDFLISATDEDKNTYNYSSSSEIPEIPYLKETTFSLNSDTTFLSYTWYLNGEELNSTESSVSFVLAKNDNVSVDGTNSLVCFFSDGSKTYATEFKFIIKTE